MRFTCCIILLFAWKAFTAQAQSPCLQGSANYEVKPLPGINTAKSEFCAVPYGNGLVFTAEQKPDLVNFDQKDNQGHPYLDIYQAQLKDGAAADIKLFPGKVNTPFHDGPVSFNSDFSRLYLTRAGHRTKIGSRNFINRSKLYICTKSDKGWSRPAAFRYNSDAYSIWHAVVSADGISLFFASDMPGGRGGSDLYVCRWDGTDWAAPQNLGPLVNSDADDCFPYLRSDGVLFFSSGRTGGCGGLDIYSAKMSEGAWGTAHHEEAALNSGADDFGIVFTSPVAGYFSSGREGGKGGDDIYEFRSISHNVVISGNVLLTSRLDDPAVNTRLFLLSEQGVKLDSTRTDKRGYFQFNNLDADKKYMTSVDPEDAVMKGKARYFLASNGSLVRVSRPNVNDKFVFKDLPVDSMMLPDIYEAGALALTGKFLHGKDRKALANAKVLVTNTYGDVIDSVLTDAAGNFVFVHLPNGQDYEISLREEGLQLSPKEQVVVLSKTGKEVYHFAAGSDAGKFKFRLLDSDKQLLSDMEAGSDELVMSLRGAIYGSPNKPLEDVKITVYAAKDGANASAITDNKGNFIFKDLKTDEEYLLNLDSNDVRLKNKTRIYVADANGHIYKVLLAKSAGKFSFNLLESDKVAMGGFTVAKEPTLAAARRPGELRTVCDTIHYAFAAHLPDSSAQKILDHFAGLIRSFPNSQLYISSYADQKGTDGYNMSLSEKRANSAADYLVSKGVRKNSLHVSAYGETKLLSHCPPAYDECADERHLLDRRTELKLIFK